MARPLYMDLLRTAFFVLLLRPLIYVLFGVNMRRSQYLPKTGPAIVVANHNSHLDTLVLMSSFSWDIIHKVRPVAAADYWLQGGSLKSWFARNIIDIIPVQRNRTSTGDPLEAVHEALLDECVVIFFPEGTRGEAEKMAPFKKGISFLVEKHSHVPVIPIFLHGLGKILPRGDFLPVPFFIDSFVGEPMYFRTTREEFLDNLQEQMKSLHDEGHFLTWEPGTEPDKRS